MDNQNFESSLLARLAVVLACAVALATLPPVHNAESLVVGPQAAASLDDKTQAR